MDRQSYLLCIFCVGLFCSAWLAASALGQSSSWRYVAEPAERVFEWPLLRAVPLSRQRPTELREQVNYRGREQLYAQLRYGSADSNRVVVVVDRRSGRQFDLYVDGDRNRVIEADELVDGTGRTRVCELEVELTEGGVTLHVRRRVMFRLGITGRSIGFGTAGFVEGRDAGIVRAAGCPEVGKDIRGAARAGATPGQYR